MPTKNNHIYEHFRGDEEFVKRMLDRVDRMERSYRVIYTPFLTSSQQRICEQLLGKQILYQMSGGYEQAEHQCLALYPNSSYEDEIHMPITCLHAQFSSKYGVLTHRDVLGALMNLGIEREQFGDIIIQGEDIYVFVQTDIVSFVMMNCRKIKRFSILFEEYDGTINHEAELEYHEMIVSSMRLDTLVCGITRLSRAKAQALIQSKLVKVNQQILEDCSYLCNNNSILSIRGYGRFLVCQKHKTTKKGNIIVEVGTYV